MTIKIFIVFLVLSFSQHSSAQLFPQPTAETRLESESRHFEVRTAPLAALVRWYTVNISYRFGRHWATGPLANIYTATNASMFWNNNDGHSIGWSGNYYLSSYGDNSWYAGALVLADDYTTYIHHNPSSFERKGWSAALIVGRQLKLGRLNLLSGLGAQNFSFREKEFSSSNQLLQQKNRNVINLYVELKLGLEF